MPAEYSFSLESLLVYTRAPVTVPREGTLRDAIQTMRARQFSQLPVVDSSFRPVGLLTYESIARCLFNFDTQLETLSAKDAMEPRPRIFELDDDALEILDTLKREHAVLIVDGGKKLHRVLTLFDAAEYFRERAQDLVFLEEIEINLRDWIAGAYQVRNDEEPAESVRYADAYRHVCSQHKETKKAFHSAMSAFTKESPGSGQDKKRVEELFQEHFVKPRPVQKLDRLTMHECIDLFLHQDAWSQYQGALGLPQDVVRNLLNKVRDARNNLAHFRPITAEQRERIRFAWDWVKTHREAIRACISPPPPPPPPPANTTSAERTDAIPDPGFADPVRSDESRYAPIAYFLSGINPMALEISLPFSEIEHLIGGKLPPSALEQRAWWANDGHSHVQARQWLNVGWRVISVDFSGQTVAFQRNKEREQQYIQFFQQLVGALRQSGAVDGVGKTSGKSYLLLGRLPNPNPVASLNFAFTRGARSRIELYLDSHDAAANKALFDQLLSEQTSIESELEANLVWERLDGHIPARVALYTNGFITDDEKTRARLTQWAADMIPRFKRVFEKRLRMQRG